ncbi:methylated-DNA--[protein]-cysteine S-methyltransferase [Undibacterium squillarum]|uniref:methylated-DNA--[protein]-cysteine S-methyltransferase n=1 Tax=Undibacterium squillarum TaxID=1131567 RepID=UPI0035AF2328
MNESLFQAVIAAPFGGVGVRTAAGEVLELCYLPPSYREKSPADALTEQVAIQVQRYLADPDFRFNLPLASVGTGFQQKVWQAIAAIPRGEVLTYGAVAKQLRSAPRAVGQACGANWFPLIIPCHRVISASGIGGFAGSDLDAGFHVGVKRWLLQHEGASW